MTRREKIIVGAMLLAVIYAVYVLFLAEPRKPTFFAQSTGGSQLESLNAFITKVAEGTRYRLSKTEAYILKKAQEKWVRDPLVEMRSDQPARQEKAQPQVLKGSMKYSGFLQLGKRRLAIINGMEYESGEKLEPGGYMIGGIYPNHVVLISLDDSRQKYILPLEEMQ